MAEPTILIIGAGTFGTSTAYHLAQTYNDPSRVTIIDRWDPTSPLQKKHAAAVDVNRIIRTDYASPLYCNLANEAIHPWFWSLELGHLFHKTGWVVLDSRGSEYAASVRKTFKERGGDYTKDIDVKEVGQKWGVRTDGYENAYFNPEAGWCDAEEATASFMDAAVKRGVARVTGEVAELLPREDGKRIKGVRLSDGQCLFADKIVLATGAWTSNLLSSIEDSLRIPPQDSIERQIQAVGRVSAYYTLSSDEASQLSKMPIMVFGEDIVAMPPSAQNQTLKINDVKTEFVNTMTTSSGQKISIPSTRNQLDVPDRLRRDVEERIKRVMPELAKTRPDRWRICWDSKTPTEDFLLCKHPSSSLPNLYLAVGGSFHSYKFMPIIGKYICNILAEKSNGAEKDNAWCWKGADILKETGRKELGAKPRATVKTELKDYESKERSSRL